ncbi:PREDICTED: putative trypsin-6 [Ceratosolen solmsi marchali]|uniref:Trypsin-6 n=1 Tax=Ceratosolen solmsi marchali TaxID=326594 RepID=A0AAJ6YVM4_9HYME|nr:PREDICTED: putative trypsin-6 [Ceratosolen solmsi marchali]
MHTISRVVIHPSYTGTLSMRSIYEHNIAVVILNEAILLNTYQNRIALPRNEPPNLVTGVTSGWGLNSYSLEQNPGEFAKSDVTILNSFHCTQMLPFLVNNGQICAIKTNGVSPTDVGGPLVYDQRVVGLLSYVRTSPRSDPGIYTSVHHYLDFIKSVIAP